MSGRWSSGVTEVFMHVYIKKIVGFFFIISISINAYACKDSWFCWCGMKSSGSSLFSSIQDKYPGETQPSRMIEVDNGKGQKEKIYVTPYAATNMAMRAIELAEVESALTDFLKNNSTERVFESDNRVCVFTSRGEHDGGKDVLELRNVIKRKD